LAYVLLTSCGVFSKVSVGLKLVLTTSRELISFVPPGKSSHEGSEKGVMIFFPRKVPPLVIDFSGLVVEEVFLQQLCHAGDGLPKRSSSRGEAQPRSASPQTEETGMGEENTR